LEASLQGHALLAVVGGRNDVPFRPEGEYKGIAQVHGIVYEEDSGHLFAIFHVDAD